MISAAPFPSSNSFQGPSPSTENDLKEQPLGPSVSGGKAAPISEEIHSDKGNSFKSSKTGASNNKSGSFWERHPVLQLSAGLFGVLSILYAGTHSCQTEYGWINTGVDKLLLPACGGGSLYVTWRGAKKVYKLGQEQLKNLGEWISQKKDKANELYGSRAVVSGLCSAGSSVTTLFLANYMGVGAAAIIASAGIGLTSSYAMGRILGEEKSLQILALAAKSSKNEINAEEINIPRDGSPLPKGIDILNGEVKPFHFLQSDSQKKEPLVFTNVRSAFIALKYPHLRNFLCGLKSPAANAVDKNYGIPDPQNAKENLEEVFKRMFSYNQELLFALNQDFDASCKSKNGLVKKYPKEGLEGLVEETLVSIIQKYRAKAWP